MCCVWTEEEHEEDSDRIKHLNDATPCEQESRYRFASAATGTVFTLPLIQCRAVRIFCSGTLPLSVKIGVSENFSNTRQFRCYALNSWLMLWERRPVTLLILSRCMRSFELFSYRPRLVLPLTAYHCRQCLNWCKKLQHWESERHNVVFSDEYYVYCWKACT